MGWVAVPSAKPRTWSVVCGWWNAARSRSL